MENSSKFLERIRTGDREAMAAFMLKHKSHIVRRVRGKLRVACVAGIDAEDIFSSCARRLDLMCMDGRLRRMRVDELASYVLRSALNMATDRIRAEKRRVRTLHLLKRKSAHALDGSPTEWDQRTIDSLFDRLCEDDRDLLELRLRGCSHIQIANELGTSIAAERKRWQRVRAKMKTIVPPPESSNVKLGAIQRIIDEDNIPQDPTTGKRMPLEIAIPPTHSPRPQPVDVSIGAT